MITRWPSPAKLNLFLYITGQREDGYHNLQTLFQFLDYSDTITIEPNHHGEICLDTPLSGVSNEQNLILRAAHLLKSLAIKRAASFQHVGARLTVDKRLPMGGGLGGGSSNAATVLVALNKLWQTGFTAEELAFHGLSLGADVPVFIHGHAAFAEGVGDKLQSVSLPEKWYLVAHPGISVSTPAVFNDPALIRDTPQRNLCDLLTSPFSNDCEPVVRKRFHKVEQLLCWLLEYAPSRLTGTGACVFAEFDTEYAARQVLRKVPEWVSAFVARGVNVSPLQHQLPGR